jgi:hypothetical protein
MSTQEFHRFQRGDWPIPAAYLNSLSEGIERTHDYATPDGGLSFGAPVTSYHQRRMFPAVITGADGSTPVKYSWSRQTDPNTNPLNKVSCDSWPQQVIGGPLYFTPPILPAYEINSNPTVPVGAVVEMEFSENGECLFFFWPGPTGTGWGGIDIQGGLITSPVPAPKNIKITNNTPTGSTVYTYEVTSQVTNGGPNIITESNGSLQVSITSTPSLTTPNIITGDTVPGVTQYGIYQVNPAPAGLVTSITTTPGAGTFTGNITTTAGNPAQPAPTSNTTSSITTPQLNTTGITASSIPAPGAATVTPTNPGSSQVSYTIVANMPGSTSPGSSTTTIATGPSNITGSSSVGLTWGVPAGVPPYLVTSITYTIYRTTPNTTSNGNGPIATVGPFPVGTTPSFTDVGQLPLPGMSTTAPSTNTTGQSTLPVLTGTNIVPLQTPGPPSVTPLTTGGATQTYGITANDGTGSTPLSPTTSISNGATTPNNVIDWQPVPGALSYGIWRTAGGASQGQIASVTAGNPLTFTDGGAAASGTAPVTNTTGQLLIGGVPVVAGGRATRPRPTVARRPPLSPRCSTRRTPTACTVPGISRTPAPTA